MATYKIKNYVLELTRFSQAYNDNGNVDSLIDENLQEMGYLNNAIIALTDAIKATNATIVAAQKAFGFLNYAFIDMNTLQLQIDNLQAEKELVTNRRNNRNELDTFLSGLSPDMLLSEIIEKQ